MRRVTRTSRHIQFAVDRAVAELLEPRRLFAAGDLDPTFSGDGLLTSAIGASSGANDVVVQSDGKIIVAGSASSPSGATSDAVLVRYNANGTLDSSFGNGGVARIDFGFNETFSQLALLPDGKIVAGGQQADGKWMLARFTASGQRDAGSGFGGTDGVQIGDGRIDELALQGSNIITGAFALATGETVVRRHLGSTGAIDTTFGTGGSVVVSSVIPELANFHFMDDLVVQGDGKILVTGVADGREGDPEEVGGDFDDFADRVMGLGRLNASGGADTGFGTGGGVRKGLDAEGTSGHAIGVRTSDGSIFVATTDGGPDANLLRVSSAGAILETGFLPGLSGDVMSAESILVDTFGNIIVAGRLNNPDTDSTDFVVTRFNADFTPDRSFGNSGVRFIDFAPAGSLQGVSDGLGAAALAPDGTIVLAGTTVDQSGQIAIARLEGNTDPTSPAIAITGGVLIARGTGGNDTFSVRRSGGDDVIVTVNALSRQFDMDDFAGVRLEGLGGNDTFNLIDPLTSPVVRNTTVFGGAGNDTVSYAARTAALDFTGITERDPTMSLAYVTMTSGAQVDRIAVDVESYKAGSGDDRFAIALPNTSDLTGKVSLTLDGGAGDDEMLAGQFVNTTLFGGAGNDSFSVDESSGGKQIFGGDGDDRFGFDGEATADIDAGAGIDTLTLFSSTRHFGTFDMRNYPGLENVDDVQFFVQTVIGNELNNRITLKPDGDATGNTLLGLGGNDTLVGGTGSDSLDGGEGNDLLFGGRGDDTLDGDSGTDFADGDGGSNTHLSIEQFAGTSPVTVIVNRELRVLASNVSERISIERIGTDDVFVRNGSRFATFDMDDFDTVAIYGFAGNDVITLLDAPTRSGIGVTVQGGTGNDSITGAGGAEYLRGADGHDTIAGSGGDDTLIGGWGNDRLTGGGGSDFMDGGDLDDFLDAVDGTGGDTVLGGNGANDSARVDTGDSTSGVESFI